MKSKDSNFQLIVNENAWVIDHFGNLRIIVLHVFLVTYILDYIP